MTPTSSRPTSADVASRLDEAGGGVLHLPLLLNGLISGTEPATAEDEL